MSSETSYGEFERVEAGVAVQGLEPIQQKPETPYSAILNDPDALLTIMTAMQFDMDDNGVLRHTGFNIINYTEHVGSIVQMGAFAFAVVEAVRSLHEKTKGGPVTVAHMVDFAKGLTVHVASHELIESGLAALLATYGVPLIESFFISRALDERESPENERAILGRILRRLGVVEAGIPEAIVALQGLRAKAPVNPRRLKEMAAEASKEHKLPITDLEVAIGLEVDRLRAERNQ